MLFSSEAFNDVCPREIPHGWELQWVDGDDVMDGIP
jgi:hypothetical protein